MSLSLSWRLSSATAPLAAAAPDIADWVQVAQAAEYAGLHGLFIASDPGLPESFTVTAALCAHTQHLCLTTSFPSEVMLPAALAAAAQSLQSISQGRLTLHLPDSEHSSNRRAFGDLLNRDQRSERIGEYLAILSHLLQPAEGPLDFVGQYFHLENAGHADSVTRQPVPLMLDETQSLALIATHADSCLVQAQAPRRLAATLQRLRQATEHQHRQLRFATTLGLILGESDADAWARAETWLAEHRHFVTQPGAHAGGSVVQLAAAAVRRFEIAPNLWRPSTLLPAFLVGSLDQVANRLVELHGLGIGHVVLQGAPAVREILRVGEELLPRLQARGVCEEQRAHGH
ncbi:LLM class flavin-dependent oxidoreductase [Metapseudomonas otitidis]|uniref:LLM class flavin-dependent oxidoreductase n=1 Tax=Metapseudomonas otitidis TaxID=319939 RepID=UPI00227BA2D7|nr:LLM class flavin-dependent oxidoreductase [Pseudomonas otitidis]WAF83275.1 LLM class flavin-dependent oxidoreductase [Pseudomonas otitidis]